MISYLKIDLLDVDFTERDSAGSCKVDSPLR